MLPLLLVLIPWAALAQPVDLPQDEVLERALWRAQALVQVRDWEAAVEALTTLESEYPRRPEVILALGALYEDLGQLDLAEETYARLTVHEEALEALGRLLEETRPSEAVEVYQRLQWIRHTEAGPIRLEARAAIKAGDLEIALAALSRYLNFPDEDVPRPEDADLLLELAIALLSANQPEEGRSLLERLVGEFTEGEALAEAEALLDRFDVEEEARRFPAWGRSEPLSPARQLRLQEARHALATGDLNGAESLLDVLEEEAARAPGVWGALGSLRQARGDLLGAERAWLTACMLAPNDPEWWARLGTLLAEAYGGRRHQEAALRLTRAVALAPEAGRYFKLAEVQRELGDLDSALEAYRASLARSAQGAWAEEARTWILRLERIPPEDVGPELQPVEKPQEVSDEAWLHYGMAAIYDRRGEVGRAIEEAETAVAMAPAWAEGLNRLGALLHAGGRGDEALEVYRKSLEIEDQGSIKLVVGEILWEASAPREAVIYFEEAVAAGTPEAHFRLAQAALRSGDKSGARAHLQAFREGYSGDRFDAEAQRLERRLQTSKTIPTVSAAVSSLILVVVLLVLLQRRRRRQGAGLREFLDRWPSAYADVAPVLAAMNHEVIKHGTTLLPAVADAMDEGNKGPAIDAASRLLGRDGGEALLDQWERYLRRLEGLGRRHGMPLNLRYGDPDLGGMCAAFRQLRRMAPRLHRLPPGASDQLRHISRALNEEGYAILGSLLREVCLHRVDRALFESCWDALRGEAEFSGSPIAPLALEMAEEALPLRILAGDLEDVVTNLFRNALEALLLQEEGGRAGLSVSVEVEELTGLEWAVFAFLDTAPGVPGEAELRGADIRRGLGLVRDRLKRHGGTLRVESRPGWSKALVVRIPLVEEAQ